MAKNDRNLSLFVYNMQLYIQRLNSYLLFEIFQILLLWFQIR